MDYYAVISLLLFMSMFLFALSIYAFIDNSTKHQKIINKIRRADEEMALTESAGKGLPSKNDGNDYFTQLMGLAFGFPEADLGLKAGIVAADKVLQNYR
jgi:heterodisulfide reductase subunit B